LYDHHFGYKLKFLTKTLHGVRALSPPPVGLVLSALGYKLKFLTKTLHGVRALSPPPVGLVLSAHASHMTLHKRKKS